MRRTTGKHAVARPRTHARALVPVGAVALAARLSGSVAAGSATAHSEGAQTQAMALIADRGVAVGAAAQQIAITPDFATAAVESAIATREQGAMRAQRATQERVAIAKRKAAAKAAAAAKAKRIAAAHRWVSPVKHPNLTSSFGYRWGRLHAGLDFGAVVGTSLHAMSSGTVTKAGWGGGYGMKVEITYWDGTVSYFAHMSQINVAEGQKVAPGEFVGKTGNTGRSTGPHLHLEIHPKGGDPVDPKPWLAKHGLKF